MRLLTAAALTVLTLASAAAEGAPAFARRQPQAQGQPSAPEDLNALNKRVRELYEAKKYDEAARLAQAAVEAAERQFGPDSPEAGQSLLNLANITATRRDTSKARKAMTRFVELREKRPGAPQPSEREALELFTCLDASDLRAKPDTELRKRIHRLLVEDSLLEQGYKLPADKAGLKWGELQSNPPPQYAGEALAARASGAVVLRITIDEGGRVVEAVPLACSQPLLTKAAAEAARRATFSPTLVGGRPVGVRSVMIYRFVLM